MQEKQGRKYFLTLLQKTLPLSVFLFTANYLDPDSLLNIASFHGCCCMPHFPFASWQPHDAQHGALRMGSGSIKEPFVILLQLLEQMWVQIIGYVQILELWMPMKCWLNMHI